VGWHKVSTGKTACGYMIRHVFDVQQLHSVPVSFHKLYRILTGIGDPEYVGLQTNTIVINSFYKAVEKSTLIGRWLQLVPVNVIVKLKPRSLCLCTGVCENIRGFVNHVKRNRIFL